MNKHVIMKNYLLLLLCYVSISATAQTQYILAEESKLSIDGTSTVHNWTVTANSMSGTVKAEANSPKEISFQVTVADIKSERGATMDKKMHAALKIETDPNVIFNLKEVKDMAIVLGSLSIAGNSQDVKIPCEISTTDNSLKIIGEYGIALNDFNIEPPTAMFGQVVVGPDVTVKFDLIFEKF